MSEPTARDVLAETICIAENKLPLRLVKHEKDRESYREGADILLAALAAAGYSVVKVPDRSDVLALLLRHRIVATSKAYGLRVCACDRQQWRSDHAAHLADAVLALFTEATDG